MIESFLAVSNAGLVVASATLWLAVGLVGFLAAVFLAVVVAIWIAPIRTVRFIVGLYCKMFYRIRVYGAENVPASGPALLTPNHVSWMDGFFVMLVAPRPVRMFVYSGNFRNRWIRWLADQWGAIMISPGPKSIVRALRTGNEALNNGEVVGIFPEGGISRNGQLQAFKPGMMKILEGSGAAVVPVCVDGMWGSIFSFERGRFFWKIPRRLPYPVSIYFGQPIHEARDAFQVRQALQALGATAMERRRQTLISVSDAVVRSCKKRKFRSKVADSSGADLTGGMALTRSLILRRLLRRHVFSSNTTHVGLLLPPTAAAVAANMAITLDRRMAVNLNYTVSSDVLNECIKLAGIEHVLTSRKFMEKMEFEIDAKIVYLEDLREHVKFTDRAVCSLQAYVVPARILSGMLGLRRIDRDDVLTIIFTSGSTGTPKGVMLTYANIAHNVQAVEQVVNLHSTDVIVGILPFFHSFGFTVTLWTVMALDVKGIYHFNPLDARQVGKLCQRHGGTILLSTPTFLRSYVRRCESEEFATLDTVVVGAEKLPSDLADAFEQKFGVRPVEGYGTTELSPLVSVNVPPSREPQDFQVTRREGSVGRCVPGVSAKIVDLDTGKQLHVDQQGMLMIHGPNVMKGYLNAPDKTSEVIHDGWYITGDVAKIDEDGFIHITGRESRFSKIGGEMVPHIKIEDALQLLVGADDEIGPTVAVTAVPDVRKGERLVVLHMQIDKSPDELCKALKEQGFPNLFIPSTDSFVCVDELPMLGTGKVDLKGIRKVALERLGAGTATPGT